MERIIIISLFLAQSVFSQTATNIYLKGSLLLDTTYHSGCWGYVNNTTGEEHAIIGGNNGTYIVNITDTTNIHQTAFFPGPESHWREITVINNYGYIVTEGYSSESDTTILSGMQILNLENNSLEFVYNETFSSAHMIQKNTESDSMLFVCGTDSSEGIHFLDITNPVQPNEIAVYDIAYFHDCHVRGDILYGCAIYEGMIHVLDISDRSNPVLITQIESPFPHSCWTTKDNKYLFVCDELDSIPATIFNIENFNNIYEVASYTGDYNTLVHNVYIRDDFAYIAHNKAGFRILDLEDPNVPVEVGVYDDYLGLLSGPWSGFPFYPSKKIITIDRQIGLLVLGFNETKGWRIYGNILETGTNQPVFIAEIILPGGEIITPSLDGSFSFGGLPDTNNTFFTITAPNYMDFHVNNLTLNSGDSLWFDIYLNTINIVSIEKEFIQIYPNPFHHSFKVDSKRPIHSIEIVDSQGKRVQIKKTGVNQYEFNENLRRGMYFVEIELEEGLREIKKIILQ